MNRGIILALAVLAALLAIPAGAAAQATGDTITVAYRIVSDDGQPTSGIATWTVNPADRATIIEETDSTVSVVLDRAGPVTLVVDVARLESLIIGGRYNDPGLTSSGAVVPAGTFQWSTEGPFTLAEGGTATVCAVGFASDGRALFVSDDLCYENLATLLGGVPPLAGSLIRRADLPVSLTMPPVYLRPDFVQFTEAGG